MASIVVVAATAKSITVENACTSNGHEKKKNSNQTRIENEPKLIKIIALYGTNEQKFCFALSLAFIFTYNLSILNLEEKKKNRQKISS